MLASQHCVTVTSETAVNTEPRKKRAGWTLSKGVIYFFIFFPLWQAPLCQNENFPGEKLAYKDFGQVVHLFASKCLFNEVIEPYQILWKSEWNQDVSISPINRAGNEGKRLYSPFSCLYMGSSIFRIRIKCQEMLMLLVDTMFLSTSPHCDLPFHTALLLHIKCPLLPSNFSCHESEIHNYKPALEHPIWQHRLFCKMPSSNFLLVPGPRSCHALVLMPGQILPWSFCGLFLTPFLAGVLQVNPGSNLWQCWRKSIISINCLNQTRTVAAIGSGQKWQFNEIQTFWENVSISPTV